MIHSHLKIYELQFYNISLIQSTSPGYINILENISWNRRWIRLKNREFKNGKKEQINYTKVTKQSILNFSKLLVDWWEFMSNNLSMSTKISNWCLQLNRRLDFQTSFAKVACKKCELSLSAVTSWWRDYQFEHLCLNPICKLVINSLFFWKKHRNIYNFQ